MILPNKHLDINRSTLGQGALILKHLNKAMTVTLLWKNLGKNDVICSFEEFSLALDFLYALGAIEFRDQLLTRSTDDSRTSM